MTPHAGPGSRAAGGMKRMRLRLPVSLKLTVPLLLDPAEGLQSADLAIASDAQRLEVVAVRRGSLTRDFDLFLHNLDPSAGTLRVGLARTAGALAGGRGSVLEIVFRVRADAPAGRATINLRQEFGVGPTSALPEHVYLAFAQFGTGNSAPSISSLQCPVSIDANGNIDGAQIIVDIREVELANALQRELNLGDAVLVGQVTVKDDTDNTNADGYELTTSLENAKVVVPEGSVVLLSTDTTKAYSRLVDAFADNVVSRLK